MEKDKNGNITMTSEELAKYSLHFLTSTLTNTGIYKRLSTEDSMKMVSLNATGPREALQKDIERHTEDDMNKTIRNQSEIEEKSLELLKQVPDEDFVKNISGTKHVDKNVSPEDAKKAEDTINKLFKDL